VLYRFDRRSGEERVVCVGSDTSTVEGFAAWSSNSWANTISGIKKLDEETRLIA
jgi:hypothetical protein